MLLPYRIQNKHGRESDSKQSRKRRRTLRIACMNHLDITLPVGALWFSSTETMHSPIYIFGRRFFQQTRPDARKRKNSIRPTSDCQAFLKLTNLPPPFLRNTKPNSDPNSQSRASHYSSISSRLSSSFPDGVPGIRVHVMCLSVMIGNTMTSQGYK